MRRSAVARALLRAFALLVRVRFCDQASMNLVRELIAEEERVPDRVFDAIRQLGGEAARAAETASRARGSRFCDPLKFLSLNISESHAEVVAPRWKYPIGSVLVPA